MLFQNKARIFFRFLHVCFIANWILEASIQHLHDLICDRTILNKPDGWVSAQDPMKSAQHPFQKIGSWSGWKFDVCHLISSLCSKNHQLLTVGHTGCSQTFSWIIWLINVGYILLYLGWVAGSHPSSKPEPGDLLLLPFTSVWFNFTA